MATRPIQIRFGANIKDVLSKTDRLKRVVGGVGSAIGTGLKVGSAAGMAALVGSVTKGVTAFAGFERQILEVKTLLPDMGQAEFGDLTDQIRGLSREFGIATDEAVPALYQAISAGVPPENVMDFMATAAEASVGGVTTLATAVDGITTAVNSYGTESLSAGRAADLMFTAVKLGKTDFDQLSRKLSNVTPIAAAVGVGFEEVAASLAVMTAQGIPTAMATTQLRQVMAELSKSGTVADRTFTDLAGVAFPDFVAAGGTLGEALQIMKTGADESGVGMQNMFSSIEAGTGALAVMTGDGVAYSKALAEMGAAAGATEAAHATMDKGMSRAWAKLKAQVSDVMISIGAGVAPVVAALVTRLQPALARIGDWFASGDFASMLTGIKDQVTAIADTAASWADTIWDRIGPAVTVVWDVMRRLPELADLVAEAFTRWGGWVIQELPGVVDTVGASLSGWKDSLVGAVAEGGVLREKFDLLRGLIPDLGGAFDWIGESVSMIVAQFKNWVAEGGALSGLWEAIRSSMPAVKNLVTAIGVALGVVGVAAGTLMIALAPILKGVLAATLGIITGAFDVLAGVIKVVTGILTGDFARVWEGLKSMFGGLLAVMMAPFEGLWAGIKAVLDGLLGDLLAKMGDLAVDAGGWFVSTLHGIFVGFPAKAITAIAGWYKGVATTVALFAGRVGSTAVGWVVDQIKAAPARLITGFTTLFQGVFGGAAAIWAEVTKIGDKIIDVVVDAIISAPGAIIDAVMSLIPGPLKAAAKGVLGVFGVGAAGGIVTKPTMALIGEAGPEAVVPLHRMPGASPLPATGSTSSSINVIIEGDVYAGEEDFADKVIASLHTYERIHGRLSDLSAV